ncbi:HYR domain-containing protein [Haliangium sp.]|uniref:HYR domain-containing protein n=1 Tax=Haliangium sp. TaxID=2663208 RepID=UPI003D0CB3B5
MTFVAAMALYGCHLDMSEDFAEKQSGIVTQTVTGFVVVSGDDADDSSHCGGSACGRAYPAFLSEAVANSQTGGIGILAIGVNGGRALLSFNSWNDPANGGPGAPVTHISSVSDIDNIDFNDYAVIYTPSFGRQTNGGISNSQVTALAGRQPDIEDFVNNQGGSLLALTQEGANDAWEFLPVPLTTAGTSSDRGAPTQFMLAIAPNVTQGNLSHCCFHNTFTGPAGFAGLEVFAVSVDHSSPGYDQPLILGGGRLSSEICDDGIDNDGDGLVDLDDDDCIECGDGVVSPGEECDDGNSIDGDGCSSDCQLEVTNQPPDPVCNDADECNSAGQCSADVGGLGAGSSDPDGDPIDITVSPLGPYAVGQHAVTVSVSDGSLTAECTASVIVRDCEAPDISCPDDFTAECDGAGQATITAPDASATDNCTVTDVVAPGTVSAPLGASDLAYTAADGAGNGASCTTTVTVVDTTAPDIACPSPSTAECTGNRQAVVDPGDAQASDICTNATVSGPDAGSFPLGTTALAYTATDEAGNQAGCDTSVTVQDTTAPTITCPAASIAECTDSERAVVDPGDAQASDICTGTTVSGPDAGSFPLGTTALVYTATDEVGNQASCDTTVTVQDTTAPTITCPAASVAECTGSEQAVVDPGEAQAADGCSDTTVTTPGAGSYPLGSTPVVYTASDGVGNTTSCNTTVTVSDTTAPVISCPAPSIAECTGNGQAVVDPGLAQASDICSDTTVTVPGASSFPLGSSQVGYTASDSSGNESSCTTSVTVQDTTAPIIICPAPIVVECTGEAGAPVIPGAAFASDVCTDVTIQGPSAGSFPPGTSTVTYYATDQSGNQSSCNTTITVEDTTPPVISVTPPEPMWPPNHKYRGFDLVADCGLVVDDVCGGILDPATSAPTITRVTSDEPENAVSDGNTLDDIVIVDQRSVKLRSERMGKGDGRVYHIHFDVTDTAGNTASGVCSVSVPHDQRGVSAVDSGVAYTVLP